MTDQDNNDTMKVHLAIPFQGRYASIQERSKITGQVHTLQRTFATLVTIRNFNQLNLDTCAGHGICQIGYVLLIGLVRAT